MLKSFEVICNCLEILKNEPDAQEIARDLLETTKSFEVICNCLEILKNEPDAQEIARDLLETTKSFEVICNCLEILKNEPDAQKIARDLLENNKDKEVICNCLEILKNEPDAQEIARELLKTTKDHQVICVCLEILKNEPDAQEIARELLENNKIPEVICGCLPILKETSEGKEYALVILNDWKNKNTNVVVRSLEVLAGTKEAESVTREIINNRRGKLFYLYDKVIRFGHGNYDCWQKEVKRVIRYWRQNPEQLVGHCLRHSEDNYFDTEKVCRGYLEEWKKRIKKVKGKRKPVFYFMTKSLAHPYLRRKAEATAVKMLEYERNNQGFLPDSVKQAAEDIVERNIFPEWHTKIEDAEIETL